MRAVTCEGFNDGQKHRLFLEPHEKGVENIQSLLANTHQPFGNTILGVSGFCLLHLASALPYPLEYIVVCDHGLRTEHFWQKAVPIITSSKYREDAIKKFIELIIYEKARYFGDIHNATDEEILKKMIGLLEANIATKISWLSSDEKYEKIKNIFDKNRFSFYRIDLTDLSSVSSLTKHLKEDGCELDVLYLSNVHEYSVQSKSISDYVSCVGKLLELNEKKVRMINTYIRHHISEPLIQRVFYDFTDLFRPLPILG